MKNLRTTIVTLLCAGFVLAGPAFAVDLRFAPTDTTVNLGTGGRLAIMIDDIGATVRTIDVYVTYDTTVVASVSGGAGELYTSSGFPVFQGIEYTAPGQWHGYAVVLGAGDFLVGPGELYGWQFQGLAGGVSPIVAVEVYLVDGDGTYYQDIVLDPTTITVFDPSGVSLDVPSRDWGAKVWPNPFNPRTTFSFALPESAPGRVVVYDLRGHEVAVLHEGLLPLGSSSFAWNGRDKTGRLQPAGQYLFRLNTANGVTRAARATLVK